MSAALPDRAKELLDACAFVVVGTVNPDGMPQTSVLWATYEGDEVLLSTIRGRQKERNWARDPRASVLILDPADPYRFVELRGTVTLSESGGVELIDRLSLAYHGRPYTGDAGTDHVRVVVRLRVEHAVVRG
jgi:PPOX class probable F420-dependent enzyme